MPLCDLQSSLRTQEAWRTTSVSSVALSLGTSLVLAIAGYLLFRGATQGTLLNNYAVTDQLMNFTRLVYALTMVLTYPLEIYVTRHCVFSLLAIPHDRASSTQHVGVTLALFASSVAVAVSTDDLGVVLALTGGFSASVIGFIMPAALYFKVTGTPVLFWRAGSTGAVWAAVPPVVVGVFGVVSFFSSTTQTIQNAVNGTE